MSPWSTGKDGIEGLIAARKLTRLVGADAGVVGHMSRARQQLMSAMLRTSWGRAGDQRSVRWSLLDLQLRRRRNELDYPVGPEDFADNAEAAAAISTATEIVDNAEQILEQGVLTRF